MNSDSPTFVSPSWLEEHLADPEVAIIDVRAGFRPQPPGPSDFFSMRSDYDRAHIPGAHYLHMVDDLSDPAGSDHAGWVRSCPLRHPGRAAGFGLRRLGAVEEQLPGEALDFLGRSARCSSHHADDLVAGRPHTACRPRVSRRLLHCAVLGAPAGHHDPPRCPLVASLTVPTPYVGRPATACEGTDASQPGGSGLR